jgi:signal peptidase I
MNLDESWKIAALIGLLAFLRIVWGLWRSAPARRFSLELLDSGLIAFILVFLVIRPFVVQAFYIPSESMMPTLAPHDRILVNKFVYRLNDPRRGDIIVFDAPPEALPTPPNKDNVKRLIGLPGDLVEVKSGDGVYINGKWLEEAPDVALPTYDWPEDKAGRFASEPYRIPEGYYFVLGDNRPYSNDSHSWGVLEAKRVLGKAVVVFWPLTRIRLLGDNHEVRLQEDAKTVQTEVSEQGPRTAMAW